MGRRARASQLRRSDTVDFRAVGRRAKSGETPGEQRTLRWEAALLAVLMRRAAVLAALAKVWAVPGGAEPHCEPRLGEASDPVSIGSEVQLSSTRTSSTCGHPAHPQRRARRARARAGGGAVRHADTVESRSLPLMHADVKHGPSWLASAGLHRPTRILDLPPSSTHPRARVPELRTSPAFADRAGVGRGWGLQGGGEKN